MAMTMDINTVKNQMHLNDAPSYVMAEESWQTDFSEPPQCDIDAAWEREIDRRLKDVLEGRVELVPWEVVDEEARVMLQNIQARRRETVIAAI